ncbi:MAG: alpha/beta hydrolase [Chloroflexi bacterium]|nr:alpha/beta hydrolase [Chloroflexota bacterium]
MSLRQQRQLLLGIVAGAAASAFTLWARRGQATRAGLADQIEEVTRQNIQQLGVAAESRFISVNGLQLHTVIAGPRDGQLIVLLHGFPENWGAWRRSIKPLVEAGFRVVVPDQRGYNLSDKPVGVHNYRLEALASDVRELIRTFGREQAIIVGHDWGGGVAWQLAMDQPEVVEKLIVINAPHPAAFRRELRENPAQQQKSWYMAAFQLPWLPELLLGQSPLASADRFFRKSAVSQEAYSSYDLHGLAVSMSQPGALTAMLNWYRASFRDRSAAWTRRIDTPTLLIWAEQDVALGKSLTYSLDQWVTNLKIHYVAHCGHWAPIEAPDEVNAQLLEFIK